MFTWGMVEDPDPQDPEDPDQMLRVIRFAKTGFYKEVPRWV